MAEINLRKGIYLKYSDLIAIPGLLGLKDHVIIRPEGSGVLIPRGVTEQELLEILKEAGIGYDMPSRKSYRVRTRLFGLDIVFGINFWFEGGKQESIVIENESKPDMASFRKVQRALRPMLGVPLEQYMAGPLGRLGVALLGGGASAEWYDSATSTSVEHTLGNFMGRTQHHIRIRYLD